MAEKKWNISPKTWLRTGGKILPSIDGHLRKFLGPNSEAIKINGLWFMIRVNTSELMMTVENDYLQYSTGTRDSGMEKYFIKDGEGRISLNVPIISNYHPLPLKYLLILGYLSIWIIWTYMSPYVLVFLWFNTFFFWRFHFHYLRFLFLLLKAGCWKNPRKQESSIHFPAPFHVKLFVNLPTKWRWWFDGFSTSPIFSI